MRQNASYPSSSGGVITHVAIQIYADSTIRAPPFRPGHNRTVDSAPRRSRRDDDSVGFPSLRRGGRRSHLRLVRSLHFFRRHRAGKFGAVSPDSPAVQIRPSRLALTIVLIG